jgi:hypothetical protein
MVKLTKVPTSGENFFIRPAADRPSPDSSNFRDSTIEDILRRDRSSRIRIVMPAWEIDPNVKPHVLDLFAYLTARADDKLGSGRPDIYKDQINEQIMR